jgi:hypothetical protein
MMKLMMIVVVNEEEHEDSLDSGVVIVDVALSRLRAHLREGILFGACI